MKILHQDSLKMRRPRIVLIKVKSLAGKNSPIESDKKMRKKKYLVICGTFTLLLVILLLGWLYIASAKDGMYLSTEHGGNDVNGNSTTGVYRVSVDTVNHPAARGECVHCHEEHASVEGSEPAPTGGPSDYLLMRANDNNLCYECHTGSLNRIWPGSGALNYDGSGHG